MKTLKEYLFDQPCAWNGKGDLQVPIRRIQADSRKVAPGDLFIAIRGPVSDGHQYVPEAIRKGVKAIVSERFDDVV